MKFLNTSRAKTRDKLQAQEIGGRSGPSIGFCLSDVKSLTTLDGQVIIRPYLTWGVVANVISRGQIYGLGN